MTIVTALAETEIELAGRRTIAIGAPDAPAAVILLHGYSMTPEHLAPFAHSLSVAARFLFPEGPAPVAAGGRAWWHMDPDMRAESRAAGPRDFAGFAPPELAGARALLGAIVDQVIAAAPARPVVLGGFSSGGMLAFDTQLRAPRSIRGLALLSATRIAWREQAPIAARAPLAGLPALLTHGRADDDLAFAAGLALRDAAIGAGAEVTWAPFDGGHEIPLVAWRKLRTWLRAIVS